MDDPAATTEDPGRRSRRWTLGRTVLVVLAVAIGLLLLIQLVPIGRDHSAPPISSQPSWPDTETEDLARAACFDCHSNETVWPWYSNVAPFSWFVSHDVEEGRARLNFSEWNRPQPELREIVETIQEGDMPPSPYVMLHSSAELTDQQKAMLIAAMDQMWATGAPPSG